MKDPFTMAPSIGARVVVGLLLGLRVGALVQPARRIARTPAFAAPSAPGGGGDGNAPASLIQLAKAFVVDDFGRLNPDSLREDFGFTARGSAARLTKKRYLRDGDLDALRVACGGSLSVSASDYRVDGGDATTVWFTLELAGTHLAAYAPPAGIEAPPLPPTRRPWGAPPAAGAVSFDASGPVWNPNRFKIPST